MEAGFGKEVGVRKLGALLDGIVHADALGDRRDCAISGVFDDSRSVRPQGLFVALRGTASDGRRFVPDAVNRGAVAVLGEDVPTDSPALVINVDNARAALARIASRWYALDDATARAAKLIGITGTNGKSTTTHMTREILRAAGLRCGMLGTVQYDLCGHAVTANMTTPSPLQLARYVRQCIDNGADAVVMEVSSHALDQSRTAGLKFSAAAFTNLTRDHLDYHGTMDAYCAAKARLFAQLPPDAVAIVNRDDPYHESIVAESRAKVMTYGLDGPADIAARITRDTIDGTVFRMRIDGHDVVLENTLVGRHNVYNAIAAAGLAYAVGAPLDAIQRGISSVRNIPGRLQRVPGMPGFDVFVDYAHTPDAIRNVGSVLRSRVRGRLIIVFGCGGDRDRTKRPLMAAAAAEFGHAVILTSDNPRTEDPQQIINEALEGFDETARRHVVVEADRRAAIFAAIGGAKEGDIVLIAGKGHEDYQIVGREKRHFDDVEVAIQAAASLIQAPAGEART